MNFSWKKLWKNTLLVLDFIMAFILGIILGAFLWLQITLLSLVVYLFGSLRGLISFYKQLGAGENKFILLNKSFTKNKP